MTAVSAVIRGGELNDAITSAIVKIQNAQLGRGPRAATTFHRDNVIVMLMYDVMTKAEKTLAEHDNDDAVTHMRHLFQLDGRAAQTPRPRQWADTPRAGEADGVGRAPLAPGR